MQGFPAHRQADANRVFKIPITGVVSKFFVGNVFKPFLTTCAAISLSRARYGKDEGVPLRRIRSNSWHARETVNGSAGVVTNKSQLFVTTPKGTG